MQFSTSPESQRKDLKENDTTSSEEEKSSRISYIASLDEKYSVVKPEPVYNEKLSENFPGSTIVKKIDGTYFAVRKSGDDWGGNEFKLMDDGSVGAVYQAHNIPPEIIKTVEDEISLTLPVIDRNLMDIGVASLEEKSRFVDSLKNLPAGTIIDIYHGLNGVSFNALKVLNSESRGVKQISGPCLSAYPLGQFWRPGGAGFKYSISKADIEFPNESKPNAKFRMVDDGTVYMINGLTELPVDQYEGVVMRTDRKEEITEKRGIDGEWKDVVVGEKTVPITDEERKINREIQKKLQEMSTARNSKDIK